MMFCGMMLFTLTSFTFATSESVSDTSLENAITQAEAMLESTINQQVAQQITQEVNEALGEVRQEIEPALQTIQETVTTNSGTLSEVKAYMEKYGITSCEVNGKSVPCEQLLGEAKELIDSLPLGSLMSAGMSIVGGIILFSVLGFIFWIWMLIDVIKHEKGNKAVWILVIVFGNFIGAIIYFFAVKIDRKSSTKPVESL